MMKNLTKQQPRSYLHLYHFDIIRKICHTIHFMSTVPNLSKSNSVWGVSGITSKKSENIKSTRLNMLVSSSCWTTELLSRGSVRGRDHVDPSIFEKDTIAPIDCEKFAALWSNFEKFMAFWPLDLNLLRSPCWVVRVWKKF